MGFIHLYGDARIPGHRDVLAVNRTYCWLPVVSRSFLVIFVVIHNRLSKPIIGSNEKYKTGGKADIAQAAASPKDRHVLLNMPFVTSYYLVPVLLSPAA